MTTPAVTQRHADPSEPAAQPLARKPRLLITTPDTGLMLRLVTAAEGEGWKAIWRPEFDSDPDTSEGWAAVALDADFGTPAFQAARAQGLTLLAVVGWWDQREEELGALCSGFLHRPLRAAEAHDVLAAVRTPLRRVR